MVTGVMPTSRPSVHPPALLRSTIRCSGNHRVVPRVDIRIVLDKYPNNHPGVQCSLPDAMESGPDVAAQSASSSTPLHLVSHNGNVGGLRVLLGHGVKSRRQGSDPTTPSDVSSNNEWGMYFSMLL